MPPRWTRGAKQAVGTAYSAESRVWYTVSAGILTEVYYPTIDTPQIRDLQYLVTDGKTFFDDERRGTDTTVECVNGTSLGFHVTNVARNGRYQIHKTLIGDPHQDSVLIHTRFDRSDPADALRLYVLCAPHLEIGGWANNAEVLDTGVGRILVAHKGSTWMALGSTTPFLRCSCGYVAVNDGWTDLADNFAMDWEYDLALDGNVAVTGEIDLAHGPAFTLGLAFGDTQHRAVTTLIQSLVTPFEESLRDFERHWERASRRYSLAATLEGERERQFFERSVNILLAHEDKAYPGAIIAALSIPWGDTKGDEELGGYHLVWNRDLVSAATALLAAGDRTTPLRALVYLVASQRADGGFNQNFWIDGRPYGAGVQLDEVSFPVVLAWRLREDGALSGLEPYRMVAAACGFLIREGPATLQERWEEAAGYSPSTLAVNIAALICGAEIIEAAGDRESAVFVREYADFLESHIERWTVTSVGSLVPGVARHYVRVNPNTTGEDLESATIVLANQPPGGPYEYPARDVVDAGFLELVRYGVRAANDPIVEDSLRVVDAVLKVDTPNGPCWRRYNHDGYGQRDDGASYDGWGVGRPWPLLTGERAHYELAAGRDPKPLVTAMENFAVGIGLLPEQIWDGDEIPERLLGRGGPTGAAIPLVWAHSEYVKLLRSVADGLPFDRIAPVHERYVTARSTMVRPIEVWSAKRPVAEITRGDRLRIVSGRPFQLHWAPNDWSQMRDVAATATGVDVWFVDVETGESSTEALRFTMFWVNEARWEGRDYVVRIVAR